MGFVSEQSKEQQAAVAMAEHPFIVASIEARVRDMVAAGVEVQGCFPERDAVDVDSPAVRAWAEGVAARWSAQFVHGPEGPHWMGCGHAASQGALRRQGF